MRIYRKLSLTAILTLATVALPATAFAETMPQFSQNAHVLVVGRAMDSSVETPPSCNLGGRNTPLESGGNLVESYSWTLNGSVVAGQSAKVFTAVVPRGANGHCSLTITNSVGSATLSSLDEAIAPTVPQVIGTPSITGTASIGRSVTCSGGGFSTTDWPITVEWAAGAPDAVAFATGPQLLVKAAQLNAVIYCRLMAWDSSFNGVVRTPSSAGVTVTRAVPKVTLSGKQSNRTLADVLRIGVQTKVSIDQSKCTAEAKLTITPKLAKQLGLLSKGSRSTAPVIVGQTNSVHVTGTVVVMNTKLNNGAKAAIKKVKSVTLRHMITVNCGTKLAPNRGVLSRAVVAR